MQEIGVQALPHVEKRQTSNRSQRLKLDQKNRTKVKDRFSNEIRAKEPLREWSNIDWKTVKKRVRNLRRRIYRAKQNGQWNKVKSLMKLMLHLCWMRI